MRTRQRGADARGVSPVLGVVLMVAITVVLAATTASFFVDIGRQATDTRMPTAAFDHAFDAESDSHTLRIAHRSGDTIAREALRVVVAGAACDNGADPNKRYAPGGLGYDGDVFTAGTQLELNSFYLCGSRSASLDLSEAEVSVTWVDPEGSTSTTLWRWQGPTV